jgi:hypothetical protein
MPRTYAQPTYSTRRRWTVVEARAALAALDASGLSAGEFARREELDVQRLHRWRRELGAGPAASPAFVEVRRRDAERIEVVLRSGLVLRVAESIDATVLRRLVAALERDREC